MVADELAGLRLSLDLASLGAGELTTLFSSLKMPIHGKDTTT